MKQTESDDGGFMGNTRICLLGVGAYLPERIMTNEEWTEHVDTSDEWITARTGIKRRRIAADGEGTVDMAVAAALCALDDAGLAPDEIDEIIVTTDTPEVYIPDTAAFVQYRLGAREIPAYALGSSGCAGFLQALDIARARCHFGVGRVLVIGVEVLSRLISWNDRNTSVLFGDAAAAFIIGQGKLGAEIIGVTAGTDGSRVDILMMEVGGSRRPFTLEEAQQGEHQHVIMNGRELFKEAVRRMSEAACRVIEQAGVTLQDIALVVPHQANLRIIQAVAKKLDMPLNKFFINVQEYGNTGSASVPLALWEARKNGLIAGGDLVLLTSFGAGFHWAAALLRF
ncbi:MAG: ketoacyl-ACP synthase III [Acidobacteria bacterium]|nr:ketoacyl-ACP synthase III [Acidobacteriota bacterium]